MSKLFSSEYSRYHTLVQQLIQRGLETPLSLRTIQNIIRDQGFLETNLFLTKALTHPTPDGYLLFEKSNEHYIPILDEPPTAFVNQLEIKWLKSLLSDPRVHLFLDDTTFKTLSNMLDPIKPLFTREQFETVRQYEDNDPYEDKSYQAIFKIIQEAIAEKKILRIHYEGRNDKRITHYFAPLTLEYGIQDDKFRLKCLQLNDSRKTMYRLNLARIVSAEISDETYPEYIEKRAQRNTLKSVQIRITNKRNSFERCFIQLSKYQKEAVFDEEDGTCLMTVYYDGPDATALLITLMSFGPTIEILGPDSFKNTFVQRLRKQQRLMP